MFVSSLVLSLAFLSSCTDKPATAPAKYSVFILEKDGRQFIAETNRLDSGELIAEDEGALLPRESMDRDIVVKDGFYYTKDWKRPLFVKYDIRNKALHEVGQVPAADFYLQNFYWLSKDTLLLTGLNSNDFKEARYLLLDATHMQPIAGGTLAIPKPAGRFTSVSIGFVEMHTGKLFIGYTYHQQLSSSNYTTSDTTYVSEFTYPELKMLKTDKDVRSAYPGGMNTVQNYTFNDEQLNFYFMTCPGIALGNRPDRPTGIFRIPAGKEDIDKDYFFDLSAPIKNHSYGIWYLGGNKALVRSERKDLFKGLNDHYSTAHFEFYVIDLSGKVLQKLALPLDKGTRRACVITEGDISYIAVNSTKEGNFIWIYNSKTGSLKKGLELGGKADFIMRIDKLR